MDIILVICKSSEFPNEKLLADISRVLKPGGIVLLHLSSQPNSTQGVHHNLQCRITYGAIICVVD